MDINGAFPSTYLKAADLQKREVTVAIDRVAMEDIGGDHKPVLYFQGKEKGLVLNKTNSMNIAAAYGPETDMWTGHKVTLYPAWVDFQGRSVEAIRCRAAFENGAASQRPVTTSTRPDLDDSIPF